MKRSFIILSIAALALSSCYKAETVISVQPQEIGFKAISSNATKADAQLEGTLLTKDYSIYAAATHKSTSGAIETPVFFKDQQFQTEDATVSATSQYRAWNGTEAAPIYWPVGGGIVDFLAYAMPTTSHGTPAATYANEATDVASEISFAEWNTYDNQVDLLYAVNNGTTYAANGAAADFVKLSFNHAQALLVFQAKANMENMITINSITIGGLKVKGTFTVDNSRNALAASWSDLEAVDTKNQITEDADRTTDYIGEPLGKTDFGQVGSSLLIPEQPRLNFTVNYTVGSKTMNYTYNEARGTWEMGKKYIYKIDMNLNEIILTEEVSDFEDANVPEVPIN